MEVPMKILEKYKQQEQEIESKNNLRIKFREMN